ncbi:MAG: SUMF1/EgtB/PvdO family nonheme iron enzyme, partial [Thermogemmata sp.]
MAHGPDKSGRGERGNSRSGGVGPGDREGAVGRESRAERGISQARRIPRWFPLVLGGILLGGVLVIGLWAPEWSRGPAPPGMVWIPGGKFLMGTDDPHPFFADAHPIHEVEVRGFWMDETEVTNADFARFVEATGYVTTAERPPTKEQIMAYLPPGWSEPPPDKLVPG